MRKEYRREDSPFGGFRIHDDETRPMHNQKSLGGAGVFSVRIWEISLAAPEAPLPQP
jgi:hypothetical protein